MNLDWLYWAPVIELIVGFASWPIGLFFWDGYKKPVDPAIIAKAVAYYRRGRISSNMHPTWGTIVLVFGGLGGLWVAAAMKNNPVVAIFSVMCFIAPIFGSGIHIGILGWHGGYAGWFNFRKFPQYESDEWKIPAHLEFCVFCGMPESGEIIGYSDPNAGVFV